MSKGHYFAVQQPRRRGEGVYGFPARLTPEYPWDPRSINGRSNSRSIWPVSQAPLIFSGGNPPVFLELRRAGFRDH